MVAYVQVLLHTVPEKPRFRDDRLTVRKVLDNVSSSIVEMNEEGFYGSDDRAYP
jgi:hypothetical protein